MVVQGLLLGRLLTGKLYEVWQLFGSAFFATKISAIYEPLFDKESQEAFLELKRYFGKSNLISTVRNKHAFHYSVEQIPAGFAKLVEDIPLDIYISEFNSNTMYAFADDILNTAMLESIVPGDHHKAMESYMEETSKVSGLFATVLGRCMAIAIQKYLNVEFSAQHHSNVSINNASKWDEVKIPFFIESPKYFSFSLELGGELEWGETSMMSPDLLSTKTKN